MTPSIAYDHRWRWIDFSFILIISVAFKHKEKAEFVLND